MPLRERCAMPRIIIRALMAGIAVIMAFPAAASAVTCHCFTDRSYDPARPTLADPYFLAATQNSFFAAVFRVDKKSIVLKKQQGRSSQELWAAYWLGTRSATDPEALMRERKTKGGWRQVTAVQGLTAKNQGGKIAAAFVADASDDALADAIVDDLLIRYRFHAENELAALRKAGAGNQELILAGLISAKTRRGALSMYREVRGGKMSWGGELQRAKIDPATIQDEIITLVGSAN